MKHIYTLALVTLFLTACDSDKKMSFEDIIASQDLELIRKKKAELDAEAQNISEQLEQLKQQIKTLDPQENITLITTITAKEAVFNHFVELQGNVNTKQNN